MKVLELLTEIEEIMESSSTVPLTGKVLVDAKEIMSIVKDIRQELPDEIQQAQWIKNERQRILDEAKGEYDELINAAKAKADQMVEEHEIMSQAKLRAAELMNVTEANVKELKLGTFEYIEQLLDGLQKKMDELNARYIHGMFNDAQNAFGQIEESMSTNINTIRGLAAHTRGDDTRPLLSDEK